MQEKSILVIEDNALNMKLIVALLEREKFQILTAEDAESGIKLAREHKPTLVLMDIQLPGMDGLSATRFITADEELREIPVVALTSHAMKGDEEEARKAGCIGYITKPIDTRSFLKTLSQYF